MRNMGLPLASCGAAPFERFFDVGDGVVDWEPMRPFLTLVGTASFDMRGKSSETHVVLHCWW